MRAQDAVQKHQRRPSAGGFRIVDLDFAELHRRVLQFHTGLHGVRAGMRSKLHH